MHLNYTVLKPMSCLLLMNHQTVQTDIITMSSTKLQKLSYSTVQVQINRKKISPKASFALKVSNTFFSSPDQ